MSAWSVRRRLAGAVIAGLALTLAPAVTTAASAADAPAAPSNVRVDLSTPPAVGTLKITWDASPSPDVSEYLIMAIGENGIGKPIGFTPVSNRTFTITNVNPGESLDISVSAVRSEQISGAATLRATAIDDNAPAYPFTDTGANTFRYQIAWLSSKGITTGYLGPNSTRFFSPSQPVLREQMAAFLYRFAQSQESFDYTAPATSPFIDVPTTATFYKEITWLNSRGITTGYDEPGGKKSFRGNQPVLREQTAAFLYRYDGAEFAPEGQSFLDVPPTATFYRQIEWLASQGITTGYAEGNSVVFRGGQAVLREQMAAFLYRYENGFFGDNTVIIEG
ncbi:S-layer homology domain-containing protein [Aeromicrobium alkaliterrae]|uniref:S-layer homology domain-containing protein n=1 Tax=Aeromicrobium alkaliterrae TaxID=302168 RepID=A0ABN2JZU4_9ACTN